MIDSLQRALFFAASTPFVRAAIREHADLSPFRAKPSLSVLTGVFCIIISFPLGWPAVVFFAYLAIRWHDPWLAALVGPAVYVFSHFLFLFGMWLSGMTYTLVLCRWLARIIVEPALARLAPDELVKIRADKPD
ncbi:MAG: hypothetical protein LBH14_03195 [Desulfobulbaceae bacterium]|jgi:hypothetical protein|nr:hypothetical protein [Desulfobulbaceae bacterium]